GAHIALDASVLKPMPVPGSNAFQPLGSHHSIARRLWARQDLAFCRGATCGARPMTSLCASPRAPAAAGTFYPRSAKTLSQTVGALLSSVKVEERLHPCGVIAPHAGYAYSGLVTAHAFASLRQLHGRIKRAIIIGPAHFVPFVGLSAPADWAFTTPLGDVPVDVATVEALNEERLVAIDDEPHAPEHAIEGELPFLQSIFPDRPL